MYDEKHFKIFLKGFLLNTLIEKCESNGMKRGIRWWNSLIHLSYDKIIAKNAIQY